MKKTLLLTGLVVLFSFIYASKARASFITITPRGEVVVNVLASETPDLTIPKNSELLVKSIEPEGSADATSQVSLNKEGDKLALDITSDSGQKSLDISQINGDLVEIEERPQVKKINIGVSNGKFTIAQEDVTAVTEFPININPETAQLTLFTPSGERFLSVLPKDAFENGLKARAISKIKDGTTLVLSEEGGGDLSYQLEGERSINLFNLITVNVPVKASISASTGEITNLDEPVWLRVFGFMFV